MAAKIVCDGCGKEAPMVAGVDGRWHKPHVWFQRSDKDGIQDACSRECVEKVAKETGKSKHVISFL